MRPLPRLLLALCLAVPAAHAQTYAPKAYAPEDLRILREDDRIRVIEREYMDQSGGRRIPDDQLEFYLDQVRSGWGFSDIKADIARSLRGDHHDGYRPKPHPGVGWGPPPGGTGRVVRCESHDERTRECPTGFRGRAAVVRQHSRTACVEGSTWGQRPGLIWVTRGCRADFAETGGYHDGAQYSVTCASENERYRTCAWDSRWGRPVVIERLSRHECTEGRSWGWRDNQIWVDRGCRARFGPAGYGRY